MPGCRRRTSWLSALLRCARRLSRPPARSTRLVLLSDESVDPRRTATIGALKAVVRSLLPGHIRSRRIRGGPLKGSRLVTSWQHYPAALLGYAETQLLSWLSSNVRPGDTWLDVGAH